MQGYRIRHCRTGYSWHTKPCHQRGVLILNSVLLQKKPNSDFSKNIHDVYKQSRVRGCSIHSSCPRNGTPGWCNIHCNWHSLTNEWILASSDLYLHVIFWYFSKYYDIFPTHSFLLCCCWFKFQLKINVLVIFWVYVPQNKRNC